MKYKGYLKIYEYLVYVKFINYCILLGNYSKMISKIFQQRNLSILNTIKKSFATQHYVSSATASKLLED